MHRFVPYPVIEHGDPNIKVCQAFTADQVNAIHKYCTQFAEETGRVGFIDPRVDTTTRVSTIRWVPLPEMNPQSQFLYEAIERVIQDANARYWQFDLTGFHDQFQYTVYPPSGGHFDWHQDRGDNSGRPQRKLSISVLLSDPAEYEGGEFEFWDGKPIRLEAKTLGTAIVFPSWIQHRVTPVTRGERISLIGWACGPKFR